MVVVTVVWGWHYICVSQSRQLRLWWCIGPGLRKMKDIKRLVKLLKKKDHIFIVKKFFYKIILKTTFVSGKSERRCWEWVFSSGKPGRRTCKLGQLGSKSFRICLASTCRHRERKRSSGKRSKQLGMRPGTSTSTGKPSRRMGRLERSRPKLL